MPESMRHLIGGSAPLRVGDVVLHAEDSLQTRREKLARIVLDGMYQFVGLLDAQGTTLEINNAALSGAGVDLDRIRGVPFWEARWFQVSREVTEATRDYVARARDGEFIRCDLEVYGQAAGEETIVVDFSLLPVRDVAGKVVFLLAEGRNITEKKRAEAEVARKTAELQALLDRVRQLDQLKSDLFANVSHELRTPLALILGPAEEMLAAGSNLTESQRRNLTVMHRNAATLLKHVNDLLDLAKLDVRKMTLSYARVDLAALVRVVAEQFHAVAPQHAIAYVVDTPPSLYAEVDADKLERVVMNLLSNAFKFTPAGGRIRCALAAADRGQVLLTVQDSGPGVAPVNRTAIFERFRQLQQGTTREQGGTGLGLAISKDFVELHGGTIGVSDAPGGGSLFQALIPLRAPPGTFVAPVAERPAAPDVTVEGVLAELGQAEPAPEVAPRAENPFQASILVVEDNPEMRRFIEQALAAEHRIIAVADGDAALAEALRAPPDLVVTDLMLPGLGGDMLVERMRTHATLADVPVLVVSARQDDMLRTRLLAHSVQDYVTKPFSAHELRARVRNLTTMKLARDALRRELVTQNDDLAQLTHQLIGSRRALQESEYRWWAMYAHAPVGVLLASEGGQIRAANPAFRSMLGYSDDELRHATLRSIMPPEEHAAAEERVQQLLTGELREYHIQRRFLRQDGSPIWARTSVSLIPGASDETRFLIVVAEDITEQKKAEEELAKAQDELARVSRVSTLGELAASIAHEVNQPLAAIVANANACMRWLAATPADEAEAWSAVQRIIRDANRASEVIARIRHFLKRGELQREPVAVGEVIEETLGFVGKEARNLEVSLRFRVHPGTPVVAADRVQLQQVLLNLVINALEAIGSSGRGGRVEITAHGGDGDTLQVDVRDTGIGIEPANLIRVFDAFHTTKEGGMGMGLAISRSIIENHGGRLWVNANDGGGVTFSFSLPREIQ